MSAPVNLPSDGLNFAPAERADVLLDFSGLAGLNIAVINTAEAPFANGLVDAIARSNASDFDPELDEDRLPCPLYPLESNQVRSS